MGEVVSLDKLREDHEHIRQLVKNVKCECWRDGVCEYHKSQGLLWELEHEASS